MPRFRAKVDLVVAGETLRVTTTPADQLTAERGLGKSPVDNPLEFTWMVQWNALRRTYPDHPAAKSFRAFVEVLDAADEIEPPAEDEPDPLDPTLEAGSDS